MNKLLEQLRGGMIVSCQAEGNDPFNANPEYMALFAKAAEMGGAIGIRTQGIEKLQAIKRATELPVIGLLKSRFPDGTVCITAVLMRWNSLFLPVVILSQLMEHSANDKV